MLPGESGVIGLALRLPQPHPVAAAIVAVFISQYQASPNSQVGHRGLRGHRDRLDRLDLRDRPSPRPRDLQGLQGLRGLRGRQDRPSLRRQVEDHQDHRRHHIHSCSTRSSSRNHRPLHHACSPSSVPQLSIQGNSDQPCSAPAYMKERKTQDHFSEEQGEHLQAAC
ncbi:hypothetical protein BD289DRAFT_210173 [Coniella lustricola]|uniref:Uncharacterized protein n=1 Tax=Coniella lustricola TaxID=2025994 RepID=A0A2T3ABS6_9PEZI|nr:hypothetical protein BD289DRAFT_210173 [Coniella lustricola]